MFTPLTLVKLAVVLLGLFNLALTLRGFQAPSPPQPRHLHTRDLEIHQLDVPNAPRTLFTEETVHYPIQGPRADSDWASLVPEHHHGLVRLPPGSSDTTDTDGLYAVSMFHTLHCLDRIRQAIIEPVGTTTQTRHHVHHCVNYVRQMILCAANTRLNPINHVQPSGKRAADGIGLVYQCRDWDAVYETFERLSGESDSAWTWS